MRGPYLALLILVLAAGLMLGTFFGISRQPSPPAGEDPVRDELAAVQRRLEALEWRPTPATTGALPAAASRSPVAAGTGTPDDDLETRVRDLEAAVDRLESLASSLSPMPDTLPGIKRALRDKNLTARDASPEHVQRRMELRQRLLELAPGDPDAEDHLRALKRDWILTQKFDRAEAVLDQFGTRVGMPSWSLDLEYANVYSNQRRFDRARARYEQVRTAAEASESVKASAWFNVGYSYVQEARYGEARQTFQALLDHYGNDDDPRLRNTLNGARSQLERATELERSAGR